MPPIQSYLFLTQQLVIIDALRFDFLIPSLKPPDPASDRTSLHWQDKLSFATDALTKHPLRSLVWKFVADPPTTTMQRLKGMTTGGMPTFIDASDNFNPSQSVLEDNWLEQLVSNRTSLIRGSL